MIKHESVAFDQCHGIDQMQRINIVLSIKMSVIRSGLLIDKVDVFSGCICSLMLLLCVMNVVVG